MVIFGPRRSCPSFLPGPRARLWRIDLRHATLLVDLHAGIRAILLADEAKPVYSPNVYQKARRMGVARRTSSVRHIWIAALATPTALNECAGGIPLLVS